MRILCLSLIALVASCGGQEETDESPPEVGGKGEAWDSANNPAYVDSTFVYDVAGTPVEGEAKNIPWAGDYWATASDSINVRWDGDNSLSPAEKVAKAFGLKAFPKWVTENVGIYGHNAKACDQDSECSEEMSESCVKPRATCAEGLTCATVPASKGGRCIAGWWGICHGWAPAAVSEPQPAKPVTKNGVTFYPGDLEGLASFVYQANLKSKFLSQRCNKAGDKLGLDNNGRIREGECRDMNPGSMFVVLTNMLGRRKVGLVEDKTYDYQVWNQPVRGYRITNAEGGKVKEITKQQAIQILGGGLTYSPLLAETKLAAGQDKSGSYQATAAGDVVIRMSGTGDADLFVKKGAAPTDSVYDCRPYEGTSNEKCRFTVAAGEKLFFLILNGSSQEVKVSLSVGTPTSGAAVYTYNTAAARFFHVAMDVSYIVEHSPSRASSSPDESTQTDSYEFILEANAQGKVVGGEWVGSSMTNHPDFMWWPIGTPTGNQGGLTYPMVKELLDKAVGPVGGPVG
jgi:hypothetical protein